MRPYLTVQEEEVRPIVEGLARTRSSYQKFTANGVEDISKEEWVDGIVDMLDGMGVEQAYNIIDHMIAQAKKESEPPNNIFRIAFGEDGYLDLGVSKDRQVVVRIKGSGDQNAVATYHYVSEEDTKALWRKLNDIFRD